MLAAAAALAVTLLILASSSRARRARSPTTRTAPTADLSSLPDECPIDGERVVVIQKAERALGLYIDGGLARSYPIGLGRRPEGHKEREGDGRTPEGEYYVCTRNPRSRFHLFLGISYPSQLDAQQALIAGRITQQQHDAVVTAVRAGSQPPWDTPLGGEIGLHGGGAGTDWTLGCIALDNEAIEDLWDTLRLGDPALIEP
jgi:murein L,D-transpeptidase YafK